MVALLGEVEAAARRGWYAAGFVAYDAAPAFDPAFRVHRALAARRGVEATSRSPGSDSSPTRAPAAPLPPGSGQADHRPDRPEAERWACDVDEGSHADGVSRIREEIAAGNTYLVNLTTRFRRTWPSDDDPFDLYCRLVGSYASGYHAYLETPDWAVACGSPELFFEWSLARHRHPSDEGDRARGRWSERRRVVTR